MSSSAETTKVQSIGDARSTKSKTLQGMIALLIVVIAIGGGLVFWKVKYGHHGSFDRITKAEMEVLLKGANPMMLRRMSEDPEMKDKQIESIRELLSIASAAEKELGGDVVVQRALDTIESLTIARLYDQELHKNSGPMPPFGFITEDQIKAFWGEGQAEGVTISSRERYLREELFKQFLNTQLEMVKKMRGGAEDIKPSEGEIEQLREEFAKNKIYEGEAKAKIKEDPAGWAEFSAKVSIQSKLQKAQFLGQLFQEKLAEKAKVSDAEIGKYIKENPEISNEGEKKTKAEETLKRLAAGEDFEALAKQLSDDPGSKENGGLYAGRVQGDGFDPDFEKAALALEPGQYTTAPVETQFGYHIIKLEKKGEIRDANGEVKATYDVRHILFSTMVKDPENPMGREVPLKDFVRMKLQDDKEKALLEELKAGNPVVIEEFEIPKVSDAAIEEMMKRQQQQANPHGGGQEEAPAAPAAKDKAGTAKGKSAAKPPAKPSTKK